MRKFESHVQWIRHAVYKEIVKRVIQEDFETTKYNIPKTIIPGTTAVSRCCVYKEREIISERVDLAAAPINEKKPIIEVIDIACDECPAERYIITEACRGCLAHRCIQVCKKDAIQIIDGKAQIDYSKCVSCGKCRDVCPYNAIVDVMRPCIKACKSKAIYIETNKKIKIDYDQCSNCGACVYQCPFGAITDRSEIIALVKAIETCKKDKTTKLYAVIAPSIVTQYNAHIGQIVAAIKKIGFKDVIEAALGADIVAYNEGLEFINRVVENKESFMMTSCCPAFVRHVKTHYIDLVPHLSTMVSPMIAMARFIKKIDPMAKVVFIGPCTAKKEEKREVDLEDAVDYVITFEELEALIDAYNIAVSECRDEPLNNASYFGRLFARSGGVVDAVATIIKEKSISELSYRPIACNGIEEVDKALKLAKAHKNNFNFIEGMACVSGCIGGAASLTHEAKEQKKVDEYAKLAIECTISESLRIIDYTGIQLHRK
ncbi:4Fe-4S dicluster domain-containing protein [Cellulosilyticum sp. I15G10I2]|uniref:4Fe-4S dicluster domain-containing protein n=1 Tax=Cellulosilyticum sp. I15G10I2 TaxID=1892843 RepID=UPI00085BF6E3|nr:4Fe-4S dicluster domain-containing protein [Cellulosilyticum sp. I15G10I2]